jgi:hypothetical protein
MNPLARHYIEKDRFAAKAIEYSGRYRWISSGLRSQTTFPLLRSSLSTFTILGRDCFGQFQIQGGNRGTGV